MPSRILNTADRVPRELWDRPNQGPDAAYTKSVVEAAELFTRGTSGRDAWANLALREALATSDFNVLLGAAFEIEMLAEYEEIAPEWSQVARPTTVRDFKPKKFIELFGGKDPFDPVGEGAEYKSRSRDEDEFSIAVKKFGNTFDLTFELRKNDELDGLSNFPEIIAAGARNTEDFAVFSQIAGPAGPLTTVFRNRAGTAVSNPVDNKPLTRANLEAVFNLIAARRGRDRRPVRLGATPLLLVVPIALQMTAEAIVNTPMIEVTEGSQKFFVPNPLAGKFRVIASYWLSMVDTSSKSNATWYVLGAPTISRPALAFARMRGEEAPDIRVRTDQGSRPGGGPVPIDEGSFNDDTISYRGRHIVGGAFLDPITTYASTGS